MRTQALIYLTMIKLKEPCEDILPVSLVIDAPALLWSVLSGETATPVRSYELCAIEAKLV